MKRPILVITIGYIIGILGANLHLILLPIIFLYPLIILILKIKKLYNTSINWFYKNKYKEVKND